MKMPGNCKFDFFLVKIPPKLGKLTDHDQNVNNWIGSQDALACQISSHSCNAFWRNSSETLFWPVSLSQNGAKMRKINRPWTKFNKFWRLSGYISMSKFRPFLLCFLQKIPGSCKFWPVKMMQKCWKSTDDDQNLISSEVVRKHQHIQF